MKKVSVGHLLIAFILVALTGAFIRYGMSDSLRMIAMAVPDFAIWAMSAEVGLYLDAVAILLAISTLARFRLVGAIVLASLRRGVRRIAVARLRARRTRRKPRLIPAKSDEDGIAFAYAI